MFKIIGISHHNLQELKIMIEDALTIPATDYNYYIGTVALVLKLRDEKTLYKNDEMSLILKESLKDNPNAINLIGFLLKDEIIAKNHKLNEIFAEILTDYCVKNPNLTLLKIDSETEDDYPFLNHRGMESFITLIELISKNLNHLKSNQNKPNLNFLLKTLNYGLISLKNQILISNSNHYKVIIDFATLSDQINDDQTFKNNISNSIKEILYEHPEYNQYMESLLHNLNEELLTEQNYFIEELYQQLDTTLTSITKNSNAETPIKDFFIDQGNKLIRWIYR